MNGCRNFTLLFFCILIFIGCSEKRPIENSFYKPYFQRIDANYEHITSGVLDTINFLFKREPPGLKDQARLYELKAAVYRDIGTFDSSLILLDSLKDFLNNYKTAPFYEEMYGEMLFSIVDIYTRTKQFDIAMNALMDAKQFIDNNVTSRCLSTQYYASVANMQMEQGRKKLAANYFLKAYNNAQTCITDSFGRFYQSYGGLSSAAYCFMDAKMYDSAQYYYDSAMSYVVRNEPKFPDKANYFLLCKAIISGNNAILKKNLRQYKEAEKLLHFSITVTDLSYPVYALSSRLDLVDIYLRAGKLDEAKYMINLLDSVNRNTSLLLASQKYSLNICKKNYYSKTADYQKAFRFYDSAFQYKDSMELANKLNIARDPGLEFEKREQIVANELLKDQYGRRSFQLLAAILLIVMVLIVALFIWLHSKRTAKHAKMLEYLNHEIHLKNTDIKDAYASLENSYRANKLLLKMVVHDLKNPIVGINSLAKLLFKDVENPGIKENLGHIITAASTATNLINDLMNKKEKKYEEIEKEVNDMMALLKYCTELMKPKAAQKKQKLILDGEPVNVAINKNEMWRVIINIINNAIKFSPENTSIDIRLQQQDSKVLLSVRDHGIGIPKEMLGNLFNSSPEIQRTGTAGEPSYGLGLKISKRIIEEHQGQLEVESIEGEGTTFFVILPAA